MKTPFMSFEEKRVRRRKRSLQTISFERKEYTERVLEDAALDQVIVQLKANGGTGVYKYSISNIVPKQLVPSFGLDEDTGEFKVIGKLDRDDGPSRFTIDVVVTDQKDKRTATAIISLNVIDVNDFLPNLEKEHLLSNS